MLLEPTGAGGEHIDRRGKSRGPRTEDRAVGDRRGGQGPKGPEEPPLERKPSQADLGKPPGKIQGKDRGPRRSCNSTSPTGQEGTINMNHEQQIDELAEKGKAILDCAEIEGRARTPNEERQLGEIHAKLKELRAAEDGSAS